MDQPALRNCLTKLLGIPPERCPLAAQECGRVDLGEVVVEKWLFTAEPGSRIPATLYRPRQITGRLPALVMTCGHGSSKAVPHLGYIAQTYAKAGVACLVADPLGEEERHAAGGMGTRTHDQPQMAYRCELAGRSVMGKFVFDAMRALDFLGALDWVDPSRLGVMGNSLGGAVAGWLFALETRLRMVIVSGWAFSDRLCGYSKHCTRVPNQKLRALCSWEEFLRLGMEHADLLVMNGDADVVIDHDGSGGVWRDTLAHLATADPSGKRLQHWFCPAGGHRPYHGYKRALLFVEQCLGMNLSPEAIAALPEINYGQWCDDHGLQLEKLYGTTLHYRGTTLPGWGQQFLSREQLAVLPAQALGCSETSIEEWLAWLEGNVARAPR